MLTNVRHGRIIALISKRDIGDEGKSTRPYGLKRVPVCWKGMTEGWGTWLLSRVVSEGEPRRVCPLQQFEVPVGDKKKWYHGKLLVF